jgi:hypothetical protein
VAKQSWLVAFAIVLVASLSYFQFLRSSHGQLKDSDTVKILAGIHERKSPLSWFKGDWPLANHFYRPIASLVFEYDEAVHPGSDAGFVATNIVLCFLSTLALFWFLRELLDSPLMATAGTLLFVIWSWNAGYHFDKLFFWAGVAICLIGLFRHGLRVWLYLPATLVWFWLSAETDGIAQLSFRMLVWIPGRTASTMTVFALISMAAWARYLRLSPSRSTELPPATPFDQPATKGTSAPVTRAPSLVWPSVSLGALVLALATYEQAVMVAALLGLIAVYYYILGRRVAWGWGWGFAAALGGYLVLRQSVISHEPSEYWLWQKRTLKTSLIMLQRYLFFPYLPLADLWEKAEFGPLVLLSFQSYNVVLNAASGLSALWEMRRRWLICGFGWLGSTLAYGPMAWFKDFEHYHYWPMAIRTIFVLGLIWVAFDLTVIAAGRPRVQAPRRLSPAPGSLLHP